MTDTPEKSLKRKLVPMQRDLMEFPTFWPTEKPERKLIMDRIVTRDKKPVPIKVILSSEMELPTVADRHYIDSLVKIWIDLGKPDTGIVPVNVGDIIKARGLTAGGKNYSRFYLAVLRYSNMGITFYDAWRDKDRLGGRAYIPRVSGKRIIQEYDLMRPDAYEASRKKSNSTKAGWVRFSAWFVNNLQESSDIRLVDQQVLSSLNVGYSYRVFEFVTKKMGIRPVWRIRISLLGQAIPFVTEMDTGHQVEAIKRVVKQLLREKAFTNITFEGRGPKTVVTFIKGVPRPEDLTGPVDGDYAAGEEEGLPGLPAAERKSHAGGTWTKAVNNLMELIATEAQDKGKSSEDGLALARKAVEAALSARNPSVSDVVDAYEETRLAYREGRIHASCMQFFLDKIKRYHGH